MNIITYAALIILALFMSACQNVSLVQNRKPDGTFIDPVSPKNGSAVKRSATFYEFQGGDFGISMWSDGSWVAPPTMLKLP